MGGCFQHGMFYILYFNMRQWTDFKAWVACFEFHRLLKCHESSRAACQRSKKHNNHILMNSWNDIEVVQFFRYLFNHQFDQGNQIVR